jgi:hypothetical protein
VAAIPTVPPHKLKKKIDLSLLCYVTVRRLVGSNYSAMGRRGLPYEKMAGTKKFVCLVN